MIELTRQEIKWVMELVKKDGANARAAISEAKDHPQVKALQQLRYDNMESLYIKLDEVYQGADKRIAVK